MKPDVWDQIEKLGSANGVEDGGQVKGEKKPAENAALADASGFQDGLLEVCGPAARTTLGFVKQRACTS